MSGLCVSYTRRLHGPMCQHGTLVVSIDGQEFTHEIDERDFQGYEFNAERFRMDLIYWLRVVRGVPLDQMTGRVCFGEEATNVKQYFLLSKDVTKTNIGTSYVNIPPGANGERTLVDFTGCTEFRSVLHAVLNGTGQHQVRIVRDSDNLVLYESPAVAAQAGEREFDSDVQPIPQGFSGLTFLRVEAKSTVAANDPVFRRLVVMLR